MDIVTIGLVYSMIIVFGGYFVFMFIYAFFYTK